MAGEDHQPSGEWEDVSACSCSSCNPAESCELSSLMEGSSSAASADFGEVQSENDAVGKKKGPLAGKITATASVRKPHATDTIRPTQLQRSFFRCRKSVVLFDDWNLPQTRPELAIPHTEAHLFLHIAAESSRVTRNLFRCSGFAKTESTTKWNAIWSKHVKPERYRDLFPFQKFNHWPGTWEMGRKDRLYVNVGAMGQHSGEEEDFAFLPRTYVMPGDESKLRRDAEVGVGKRVWIVKPCASARGKGIRMATTLRKIPMKRKGVVQEYIDNPLVVNGKKFDLRLYVVLTSIDPLRVYIHENGLARFATEQYSSGQYSLNSMVHLTNFSIQKGARNFVNPQNAEDTAGDKWSLRGIRRHILETVGAEASARLWVDIDGIIIKTLLSILARVRTLVSSFVQSRGTCYEIFGFDVLIDDNLKPWLLEVNISPALSSSSPLDKELKGQVIRDLLNMVGFQDIDPREYLRKHGKRPARFLHSLGRTTSRPAVEAKDAFSVEGLSAEELEILQETEDEYHRRGGFRRLFPTADTAATYRSFFLSWSNYDNLVHRWLSSGLPVVALDIDPPKSGRPPLPVVARRERTGVGARRVRGKRVIRGIRGEGGSADGREGMAQDGRLRGGMIGGMRDSGSGSSAGVDSSDDSSYVGEDRWSGLGGRSSSSAERMRTSSAPDSESDMQLPLTSYAYPKRDDNERAGTVEDSVMVHSIPTAGRKAQGNRGKRRASASASDSQP